MVDISFGEITAEMMVEVRDELESECILGLPISLNHGKINGDIFENQARYDASTLKYYYDEITSEDEREFYLDQIKKLKEIWAKLKHFLESGAKIRLWLNNTAKDRCGLYWLCSVLKDYDAKLYTVVCPEIEYDEIENKTRETGIWPFCSQHMFPIYCNDARPVEKSKVLAYSAIWERLAKENSLYRIMIDNTVISTERSFFDELILSRFSSEPKTQEEIMGKLIGRWQCFDVAFLSERIEHLLDLGKLQVCEHRINEDDCYWPRTLSLR